MVSFSKRYQYHQIGTLSQSGCLSSTPNPSSPSLPPLRVTLAHFTLSSYKRALRLPTSFPILCSASLGVKPRLSRSSWRTFAFTRSLMLPSTSPREALLACPPSPLWNLSLFTVESPLSLHAPAPIPLSLSPRCGSRSLQRFNRVLESIE